MHNWTYSVSLFHPRRISRHFQLWRALKCWETQTLPSFNLLPVLLVCSLNRALHRKKTAYQVITEGRKQHINLILLQDQAADIVPCPHAFFEAHLLRRFIHDNDLDFLLLSRYQGALLARAVPSRFRLYSCYTVICIDFLHSSDVPFTHVKGLSDLLIPFAFYLQEDYAF